MGTIQPKTLPLLNLLMGGIVRSHLPGLDARFRKECGKGLFSKRCREIQSYTFSYLSQTVDGRETEMSGRVTFLNNKEEGTPHQAFFNEEWAPSPRT